MTAGCGQESWPPEQISLFQLWVQATVISGPDRCCVCRWTWTCSLSGLQSAQKGICQSAAHQPPLSVTHLLNHTAFRVTPGVQSRLFWSVVPWWRNKLPESVRTERPLLSSGISWKLISTQTCLTSHCTTIHWGSLLINYFKSSPNSSCTY